MTKFDMLLNSLSPDELPELTVSELPEASRCRIEKTVARGIKRRRGFDFRQLISVAAAIAAIAIAIPSARLLRHGDVGVEPGTGELSGSVDIGTEAPNITGVGLGSATEDGVTVTAVETLSDYSVASKTETSYLRVRIDCPKPEGEFILASGFKLVDNADGRSMLTGRVVSVLSAGSLFIGNPKSLEDSKTAILAGDIFALIKDYDGSGIEVLLELGASLTDGGDYTLSFDSLWSAELVGEMLSECVTYPLADAVSIDFRVG